MKVFKLAAYDMWYITTRIDNVVTYYQRYGPEEWEVLIDGRMVSMDNCDEIESEFQRNKEMSNE